jgi:UDP-glucose 4-epimerase
MVEGVPLRSRSPGNILMARKRFLVTGGCGFIGSHLVERLISLGYDVRVLDNLSAGQIGNVPPGTDVVVGDIVDADAVGRAMLDVAGCFHLAAIASVVRCNDDPANASHVNLAGTVGVLHAAARGRVPVVYASSAAVYGAGAELPLSEAGATVPLSIYGADKLAGEIHARVVNHLRSVPVVSLRLFNVYGPRQDPSSPYSGVISIFADRIARGRALSIYGDGLQRRDFVYVGDVVDVLIAAMMKPAAGAYVCNVCSGTGISIRGLAEILAELHGATPSLEFVRARPGDIRLSVGDPSRMMQAYRPVPPTPLQEGLIRLLTWMHSTQPHAVHRDRDSSQSLIQEHTQA